MALLESYMYMFFLYVSTSYPWSWNVVYTLLHNMLFVPKIVVFYFLIHGQHGCQRAELYYCELLVCWFCMKLWKFVLQVWKVVFKMYCYDTRITIVQFIPALQGLGIMNGITGGWTTHLRQKIWNIHLIYQCLLIEVIQSCVRLFAATSPRHIGKHYSWSFLFICF